MSHDTLDSTPVSASLPSGSGPNQPKAAETRPREPGRTRPRTLYRHPRNRLIGGVCGGLAEFLGLDANLVRILWIVLTVGTLGAGFLAYLLLWLLLPVGTADTGPQVEAAVSLNERNVVRAGALLISLGTLWLLANLGVLPWLWNAFWSLLGLVFWPVVLIGAGLLLLKNQESWRESLSSLRVELRSRVNGVKAPSVDGERVKGQLKSGLAQFRQRFPLKRSRSNRLLLGVCGGMGEALGIDANLVRLLWVAFSIGSVGTGVLIYVLLGLLLPEETPTAVAAYQDEPQEVTIIDGTAR